MRTSKPTRRIRLRWAALMCSALTLAACEDFDMRDRVGGFDTSRAAASGTAPRPEPDARGVISYPGYQVAVARRNDTLETMASRLGVDAAALARFNGISTDVRLRRGEIIALPARVAETDGGTADLASIASAAIEAAPADAPRAPGAVESRPLPSAGPEPVRHRVARGETAFTIARLYNVPVSSLAEWNGLGADFALREGQFLLIPVANTAPPARDVSAPGTGSATPAPPSSTTPVPERDETPAAQAPAPAPQEPDAPAVAAPQDHGEFLTPVAGTVIRGYARGRNDGVDFGTTPGAVVKATADGTVAALTIDTNAVSIIVIRHDGGLLSVYSQLDEIRVAKGDRVRRGEDIATVKAGDPTFLHFEIRDSGLNAIDPATYLDL